MTKDEELEFYAKMDAPRQFMRRPRPAPAAQQPEPPRQSPEE